MSVQNTHNLNANSTITNTDFEHDITSIVEALENKTYVKKGWNPFQLSNESEIYTNIDIFTLSMNSTMESLACSGAASNVINYIKRLKKLEYNIQEVIQAVHKKSKWKFICNTCHQRITVLQKENIWNALQSHEHIENQYVAFMNARSTSTSTNQICKQGSKLSFEIQLRNILKEIEIIENMVKSIQLNQPATSRTQSCLEDDSNGQNFKFNFKLVYDKEVEKLLYPAKFMVRISAIDNISDYTIQINSNCLAYCLLCRCDLPLTENNIISHAGGSRHSKAAVANSERLNILHVYHSSWIKLNPVYQWHQVWFDPDTVLKMVCKLCLTCVHYDQIESHLKQEQHKNKFLTCSLNLGYAKGGIIEKQMVLYNGSNKTLAQIDISKRKFLLRMESQVVPAKQFQVCVEILRHCCDIQIGDTQDGF